MTVVLAWLAALPTACHRRPPSPATDARELDLLLTALAGGGAPARAAAERLLSEGEAMVDPLICALSHPDWQVRFQLLPVLDKLQASRAIPALVTRAVLEDNHHVRYRTLALLKGGYPARTEPARVRDELQRHHTSGSCAYRWHAAYALACLGDVAVLDEIKRAVHGPDHWRSVEAVWALKFIHDDEAATLLAALLPERRGPALWNLIDSLAAIPGDLATEGLHQATLLDDPTAASRAERALAARDR